MTDKPLMILYAEDSPIDRLLFEEAMGETDFDFNLRFVADGQELIDYLQHSGQYADPASAPKPDLILADINLPRKNGDKALIEIKGDPLLRAIPVIIFSALEDERGIYRLYDLGAILFIPKPESFDSFEPMVREIGEYWTKTARLPRQRL
jgi:CheY-like chemotaxis protein